MNSLEILDSIYSIIQSLGNKEFDFSIPIRDEWNNNIAKMEVDFVDLYGFSYIITLTDDNQNIKIEMVGSHDSIHDPIMATEKILLENFYKDNNIIFENMHNMLNNY